MRQPLAFQQQGLHFLLHARVRVVKALLAQLLQLFGGEGDPHHGSLRAYALGCQGGMVVYDAVAAQVKTVDLTKVRPPWRKQTLISDNPFRDML